MSQAVWKYTLGAPKDGICEIEMPEQAVVLKVSAETGEACLWALVDTDANGERKYPMEKRRFRVVGTGHKILDSVQTGLYRGTFFVPSDAIGAMFGLPQMLVFHVFEIASVRGL